MRLVDAAYYVSVSESTFANRVRDGLYPKGRREGGMTFWLRDELDDLLDQQFAYDRDRGADETHRDPFLDRFGSAL